MWWRVAQAAAQEGAPGNPDEWTNDNRRYWASSPGWSEAWESARASHPDDPTYDPGTDEAVITDGMILATVQQMIGTPADDEEGTRNE
jgi:hypothetical protein